MNEMLNEMSKVLCVHPSTLDAWFSGAIVKYRYPNASFIVYDGCDKFDIKRLIDYDVIIFIGFIPPITDIYQLCRNTTTIYILDISYDSYNIDMILGKAVITTPGTLHSQTWKYLYPRGTMPNCLKLLTNFTKDVIDVTTLTFHYGVTYMVTDVNTAYKVLIGDIKNVRPNPYYQIMHAGEIIKTYVQNVKNKKDGTRS